MEVREDFLERDDVELRSMSLKDAKNWRTLATGGFEQRWGTFYERTLTSADDVIEIRPTSELRFGLILNDTSFDIIDTAGDIVHSEASVPWTSADGLWVQPFRAQTIIGGETAGIWILEYDAGVWSFTEFEFQNGVGGEMAQPYWVFNKGVTIQPTARTGTVTVTASSPVFSAGYVGLRIRYLRREIVLTEYLSPSSMRGTVSTELPPSFTITVGDGGDFRVGDAVVGADTNYQGIITGISGNDLSVATLEYFAGPDNNELLSGPAGSSKVSSKSTVSPLATTVWDEPLMSDVRGWPRAASAASGRLILCDFPLVPSAIGLSSARDITDWEVGADDDDAIVREVGDDKPRFRHAINAGDLLLLSDRGLYYIPIRDTGILTPSTFNPVRFDERGANGVKPVLVEDGAVFVETNGKRVSAARLDGNIYLKWSVVPLTVFHDQAINAPTKLCGPSLNSVVPEKYLFVVNGDGTLAAVSWETTFAQEKIGFCPWDTNGTFVSVSPLFDSYWCIVDRVTSAGTRRFLERFDPDAKMDCAVSASETGAEVLLVDGDELTLDGDTLIVSDPAVTHIPGMTVRYYQNGWFSGEFTVNSDGTVTDPPSLSGDFQIGLNFEARAMPWPVEAVEVPWAGMRAVRVITLIISVQGSGAFQVRCNSTTRTINGYSFADDLTVPPPQRTRVIRVPVFGVRDHPEMEIIKHVPGTLRVLSIGQEVQV